MIKDKIRNFLLGRPNSRIDKTRQLNSKHIHTRLYMCTREKIYYFSNIKVTYKFDILCDEDNFWPTQKRRLTPEGMINPKRDD